MGSLLLFSQTNFLGRLILFSVSSSESCLLTTLHPVKVYVCNSSWHHIYKTSQKELLKLSGFHSACKDIVNAVSIYCFQTTDVNVKGFLFLSTLFSAAGMWEAGRSLSEGCSTHSRPAANQEQGRGGSSGKQCFSFFQQAAKPLSVE